MSSIELQSGEQPRGPAEACDGGSPPSSPAKWRPVTGVLAGTFKGLVLLSLVLWAGGLLTVTGIGAVVGVPILVLGVPMALLYPFFTAARFGGPCPRCGEDVAFTIEKPGVDCPGCKGRIVLRKKRLVLVRE